MKEDPLDAYMLKVALERKDDVAYIPLAEVIAQFDLDIKEIEKLLEQADEL